MITEDQRQRLREAVRFFYDLQKLRIQQGNRAGSDTIMLDTRDIEFHETRSKTLNALERAELKNIERLCKESAPEIYKWLRAQKGIGPTMAGVILSEVDIYRAETVSALWKYAGLGVEGSKKWVELTPPRFSIEELQKMETKRQVDGDLITTVEDDVEYELKFSDGVDRYWLSSDGTSMKIQQFQDARAPRRTKGQKLTYNSWFRTKMVGVAAGCMIQAGSDWRRFYDNYKTRKENQLMPVCENCRGTGVAKIGEHKGKKCKNCNGSGKNAPWGVSAGHRNRAAIRYMMKQFLKELWLKWREIEGLEVHAPYAEAVLGRVHGDHRGTHVQPPA